MQDQLANTILQKLATLPYGEVSEMLNSLRAMQHVLVDPTTRKVLDQSVAEKQKNRAILAQLTVELSQDGKVYLENQSLDPNFLDKQWMNGMILTKVHLP